MKKEIGNCKREEGFRGGMSEELYQNARQTIGELRSWLRASGISWAFLQQEIDRANSRATGIDHALDRIDPYTTGAGRSLSDLPSNIR